MAKPTDGEILNALSRNLPPTTLIGQAAVEVMKIINAAWDAEASEVERFNHDQRVRREACEAALPHSTPQERASIAAARYPLRVRARKVVPDPFGGGEYTTSPHGEDYAIRWRRDTGMDWQGVPPSVWLTPERVALFQQLFSDPWTWSENPSVES